MNAGAALVSSGEHLPRSPWARPVARLVDSALGLDGINRLYGEVSAKAASAPEFCELALAWLGVETEVEALGLERLAAVQGSCMVVANHPLGGRDALLLNVILGRARPDYRIVSNSIIGRVPEVRDKLILVDPFGGLGSAQRNSLPLRQAIRWMSQGGLLGVFPAGEVSLWRGDEGRVADKAWAPQVARLALAAKATVVPLHFDGRSSAWFRALGRLHPVLKTPFLARELLNGPSRRLSARLGQPIPCGAFPFKDDPRALSAWMRERTYELAGA